MRKLVLSAVALCIITPTAAQAAGPMFAFDPWGWVMRLLKQDDDREREALIASLRLSQSHKPEAEQTYTAQGFSEEYAEVLRNHTPPKTRNGQGNQTYTGGYNPPQRGVPADTVPTTPR